MGYDQPLNVRSIRIIKEKLNLQKQITAITSLDNMISENVHYDNEILGNIKYGMVIKHLFDYTLGRTDEMKYNPYLYKTFRCFADHKKKVHLRIERIYHSPKSEWLINVIFYDLVNKEMQKDEDIFSWIEVDNEDNDNLLQPQFFGVFKNLEELEIDAWFFPFSLFAFLSLLENTSINKVTIRNYAAAWSALSSSQEFDQIKGKYADKQFGISFNEECDELIIAKS